MNVSKYFLVGRYIPTNSFVHKLDPRTKIILSFILVIEVFLVKSIFEYLLLFIVFLGLASLSMVSLKYFLKSLYPVLWLVLITSIIHLFMTKGGGIIFEWSFIEIHSYGLHQALFISTRIILLILIASLLTVSTTSIELTIGLERLFSPLRRLKVPVSDIALMMSISLRFIPILLEETDKIIKSQIARGAKFDSGPFFKRVYSLITIVIPLFIGAFKRADDLAVAMESRGFAGSEGRSKLREIEFSSRDVYFLVGLSCLLIIIFYLR